MCRLYWGRIFRLGFGAVESDMAEDAETEKCIIVGSSYNMGQYLQRIIII